MLAVHLPNSLVQAVKDRYVNTRKRQNALVRKNRVIPDGVKEYARCPGSRRLHSISPREWRWYRGGWGEWDWG